MSKEEWQGIYRRAWDAYYDMDHLETLMRRLARQLAHAVGDQRGHLQQLAPALVHGLPAALVALAVAGGEVLAAVELLDEHAEAAEPDRGRALAGGSQVHLEVVGGVEARRQVDELLRVGPDLAADVQALQAMLLGELGAGGQQQAHRGRVERHLAAEEVVRIQQVAVARGAKRE